jgi:alpha(1,3/1,4) fucosyltransferase
LKKVCVVNFWDGAFDGDFFDFFFNLALGGIEYTNSPYEADVVISSVFGHTETDPKKTIMYIGENVRPSFVNYNYSLSFDYDTYGGRNFRLPLWWSRLAWDGFEQKPRRVGANNHGYEQLIDIKSLLRPRKLDMSIKNKFCAMIAGNPEGLRINMFNSISQYKPVHGYGNMFGNSLRKSKFAVLPEYKFCLCPENSVYEGYVTEKLIDAYAGLTVPLYSGDVSVIDDFNYEALLNYQDARDMEYFVANVKDLDENLEFYQTTYEQPLLLKEPSLNEALAFVYNVVKEMA